MTTPAPLVWNLPETPPAPTLLLKHGADAPSTHPNTTRLAELIAERGVRVARFDFPYMRRAQAEGRRPWPPDPEEVLAATWLDMIRQLAELGVPTSKLFIGGRSMGGPIASYIADAVEPAGMICTSYPFPHAIVNGEHHPPSTTCDADADRPRRTRRIQVARLGGTARALA